nr:mannose-6-phosphate isomerase, class I [Zhihengliuella flava]
MQNTIRDYAWGTDGQISAVLGYEPTGAQEAELWLGAHPGAPSRLVGHADRTDGQRLDEVIAADPEGMLGAGPAAKFGRLPFLTKVLSAGSPLSLQVHPTADQAAARFAQQSAAGGDPADPASNYKDPCHKPEMILALTDFTALCGFREPAEAGALFGALEATGRLSVSARRAVATVRAALSAGELNTAFAYLLGGAERAVPPEVSALVAEVPAVAPAAARATHEAGVAELERLAAHYPADPGVLISLLLNHVQLAPGQAIALPAGNVHAYLRGLGIEVMASSDNVLRGGLTPKHVDVAELLSTVDFRPLPVPRVEPVEDELGRQIYRPGFDEFELQVLRVGAQSDVAVDQRGPAVVLVTDGALLLDSPTGTLRLSRGDSVFIPASEAPVVARSAHSTAGGNDDGGTATAYAVTLPPSWDESA